jgi:hypothetical protein
VPALGSTRHPCGALWRRLAAEPEQAHLLIQEAGAVGAQLLGDEFAWELRLGQRRRCSPMNRPRIHSPPRCGNCGNPSCGTAGARWLSSGAVGRLYDARAGEGSPERGRCAGKKRYEREFSRRDQIWQRSESSTRRATPRTGSLVRWFVVFESRTRDHDWASTRPPLRDLRRSDTWAPLDPCPVRRHRPVQSPSGEGMSQPGSTSANQRAGRHSPCRPRFAPGSSPGRSASLWKMTRGPSPLWRRSGTIWSRRAGSPCGAPPAPNGSSFAFGATGLTAPPIAVHLLGDRRVGPRTVRPVARTASSRRLPHRGVEVARQTARAATPRDPFYDRADAPREQKRATRRPPFESARHARLCG